MRALIRCDIGGVDGLGHGVRCFALARHLAMNGVDVRFVTRSPELPRFLEGQFVCRKYFDGADEHLMLTRETERWCADALIIDHKFSYDNGDLCYLNEHVCPVVRIDHPDALPSSCALLVAPVAHWSPETVTRLRSLFGPRFLYGWDYVLLAPEVTRMDPIPYQDRAQGPIVFCAGGSDPTGALAQMLHWSEDLLPEVKKIFAYGAMQSDVMIAYHQQHADVTETLLGNRMIAPFSRELLQQASMVVSLFGVTPYECLYYQTPILILARTSEDAFDAVRLTGSARGAIYVIAGSARGATYVIDMMQEQARQRFCSAVASFWNMAERHEMHRAANGLFDGQGLERVTQAILKLGGSN